MKNGKMHIYFIIFVDVVYEVHEIESKKQSKTRSIENNIKL